MIVNCLQKLSIQRQPGGIANDRTESLAFWTPCRGLSKPCHISRRKYRIATKASAIVADENFGLIAIRVIMRDVSVGHSCLHRSAPD